LEGRHVHQDTSRKISVDADDGTLDMWAHSQFMFHKKGNQFECWSWHAILIAKARDVATQDQAARGPAGVLAATYFGSEVSKIFTSRFFDFDSSVVRSVASEITFSSVGAFVKHAVTAA